MTFAVRDLMLDVLPETSDTNADGHELRLCEPVTSQGPRPHPKPPQQPPPKPKCMPVTTQTGPPEAFSMASGDLPALEVLRQQLHQALHP